MSAAFDDAPIRHVDETDHAADLDRPEYWESVARTEERLAQYFAEEGQPIGAAYHRDLAVRFNEHAARLRRTAA